MGNIRPFQRPVQLNVRRAALRFTEANTIDETKREYSEFPYMRRSGTFLIPFPSPFHAIDLAGHERV